MQFNCNRVSGVPEAFGENIKLSSSLETFTFYNDKIKWKMYFSNSP